MSSEEIIDWMAYEQSVNPEFIKKMQETPIEVNSPQQEADAIRSLFASLGNKEE